MSGVALQGNSRNRGIRTATTARLVVDNTTSLASLAQDIRHEIEIVLRESVQALVDEERQEGEAARKPHPG